MHGNAEAMLIQQQHGVVSRRQLLAAGLTKAMIDRRVAKGTYSLVKRGVYKHWTWPWTWHGRVLSLCLAHRALATRRTAAFLLGIDGFRKGRPELLVPHHNYKRIETAQVHTSTQMDRVDLTLRQAIPCTGVPRTVLDLAAKHGSTVMNRTIDAVLRQKLATLAQLYSVVIIHARRGRDGTGRLRLLLEDRSPTEAIPDSVWNRMVGDLLISAGLGLPEYEYVITDANGSFVGRADLAYPDQRVVIELDSLAWHHNVESFHRDPQRKNRMVLAGYQVLTFTWKDYAESPRELTATVAAALRRSGRLGAGAPDSRYVRPRHLDSGRLDSGQLGPGDLDSRDLGPRDLDQIAGPWL